jgi:hypothetical protein
MSDGSEGSIGRRPARIGPQHTALGLLGGKTDRHDCIQSASDKQVNGLQISGSRANTVEAWQMPVPEGIPKGPEGTRGEIEAEPQNVAG